MALVGGDARALATSANYGGWTTGRNTTSVLGIGVVKADDDAAQRGGDGGGGTLYVLVSAFDGDVYNETAAARLGVLPKAVTLEIALDDAPFGDAVRRRRSRRRTSASGDHHHHHDDDDDDDHHHDDDDADDDDDGEHADASDDVMEPARRACVPRATRDVGCAPGNPGAPRRPRRRAIRHLAGSKKIGET